MSLADIVYLPESPAHDPDIDAINEEAFGPGRFTRAAYKIREGGPHERSLSFVALHWGSVVASVRQTRITVGGAPALLLGPLTVRPDWKNLGIGRKLLTMGVAAAKAAGAGAVVLVGDEPYYGPFGFRKVSNGQMVMPRPVDPARLLAYEIVPGAVAGLRGEVVHADRGKG